MSTRKTTWSCLEAVLKVRRGTITIMKTNKISAVLAEEPELKLGYWIFHSSCLAISLLSHSTHIYWTICQDYIQLQVTESPIIVKDLETGVNCWRCLPTPPSPTISQPHHCTSLPLVLF
jgi:hypothetical protein